MPPAIIAVASIGATLVAGQAAKSGAGKIARAQEKAADAQLTAAREAQELLKKRVDEAVSDSEAAELKAQGLISEGTEQRINQINQSTEGFIQNIQNLQQQVTGDEQNILQQLASSGAFTREELESGVLDAIGQTAGFNERAIAALSPFNEAGQRALRQIQFSSGLLTPQEQTEFREEFGIAEGEQPRSATARAAEEAALRRLRASGISQSGFALEDLAQTAALVEQGEQQQRQQLATQGLQAGGAIAGLESGRGRDVLGALGKLRTNIASQRLNESERARLTQTQAARARLGLGQTGGEQQLLSGLQTGQLQQAERGAQADLALQQATQRGNVRIGEATQSGRLGTQAAQLAAPLQTGAAQSRAQGDLFPLQAAGSALNILSEFPFTPQKPEDFIGPPAPAGLGNI